MPEARRLVHSARLAAALDLAANDRQPRDVEGAIAALDALARDPWDEHIGLARIVRATLTAIDGSRSQADAQMTDALREWQERQETAATPRLPADFVADVAEIRRHLLESDRSASWRASFGWRPDNPQFPVLNPHVTVTASPGTPPVRELVYPVSRAPNLLLMTTEQMDALTAAMNLLVREAGRPGRPAPDLLNFLGTHLPVEQGMLGGFWSFASIPSVGTVTFTNAERTRATVAIRASYSGGALEMAKEGGRWTVVGVLATYVN